MELGVTSAFYPKHLALVGSPTVCPLVTAGKKTVLEVRPDASVAQLARVQERVAWVPPGYEPTSGLMIRRIWPDRISLFPSEEPNSGEVAQVESAVDLVVM